MSSDGLHGRKRQTLPPEVIEAKLAQDKVKIQNYQSLCQEVYDLKNQSVYNERGLELTREIILLNSDFNTIWNFRRNILINLFKDYDNDMIQNYLENELRLVEKVIMMYPKSYWLWNHRRWVLEYSPNPNWNMELKLVGKMLELDNRNFHGWNYRRHILDQLFKSNQNINQNITLLNNEIQYTTSKIQQSFSNGSAWFYRTKLIEKKLTWNQQVDFNYEYDLVKNAAYTDPEDQSAWIYYRWLINRDRFWIQTPKLYTLATPSSLDIVMILQDDHLNYSQPILKSSNPNIQSIEWNLVKSDDEKGQVFKAPLTLENINNWDGELEFMIDIVNPSKLGLDSNSQFIDSWKFKIDENIVNNIKTNNIYQTIPVEALPISSTSPKLLQVSEAIKDANNRISKELEELQELVDLEPDSKWVLQTQVYLREHLNNYHRLLQLLPKDENSESIELLDTKPIYNHLIEIDSFRKTRYHELSTSAYSN